jgi:hypothetical protein
MGLIILAIVMGLIYSRAATRLEFRAAANADGGAD